MSLDWQLGDLQTSSKGIRSAPISDAKGGPIVFQLTSSKAPLTAPFGSSAFNDPTATRQNICFRCTPELEKKMTDVDAWMMQYILDNSQRLFKNKTVTYKPCLSLKEDYPALLRTKINVGGSKTCRFWNMFGKRIEAPENMKECMLVPRVVVRSLWVMGSECGLIIEVTDMMYDEKEEECPFPIDQPLL